MAVYSTKWKYACVVIKFDDTSDHPELDEVLQKGWEPFAVTLAGDFHHIHIRKQISERINTGPG